MSDTHNNQHAQLADKSTPHSAWWRAFLPARTPINAQERLRTVCGGLLGIALTAILSHCAGHWLGHTAIWLLAPIGASAVLVFAAPSSPMAQPWAVIGGNSLSALIGIAVVHATAALSIPELSASLAVGLSIAVMLALRCLHPPGGASALTMALGGISDPGFALFPMMINSLLLVSAGIAYNYATGRAYPHAQQSAPKTRHAGLDEDLDRVLAHYNQVLDVSRDDLKNLLNETQVQSYLRKMDQLRCADIMSRELITVEFGTPLEEAWTLLHSKGVKALPVVDNFFRLVGILTLADFIRSVEVRDYAGFQEKLRSLMRRTAGDVSIKPEVVGQIMTRQVRVTSEHRHLADLVPLFSGIGHHHLPVIDANKRLVGIITQSDMISAIHRINQSSA